MVRLLLFSDEPAGSERKGSLSGLWSAAGTGSGFRRPCFLLLPRDSPTEGSSHCGSQVDGIHT